MCLVWISCGVIPSAVWCHVCVTGKRLVADWDSAAATCGDPKSGYFEADMNRFFRIRLFVSSFLLFLFGAVTGMDAAEKFDLIIKGGRIVDGTGAPWYVADLGIRDGKISRIGRLDGATATRVIDATGLIVSPGFIDMMGQTSAPMLGGSDSVANLLAQGITTINCGEGSSDAPQDDQEARRTGWKTMAEYFQFLDMHGLTINAVQTVGHTEVRQIVIGNVDRRPTADEMDRMKALVREGMEAGAIGVSTALIYPPAVYATTEEIAELAEVAGEYGGRYFTHMRNEGEYLLEAIDEAIQIGRTAKTPVHIFHLKAAGRQNWGKMELAIARIGAARAAGRQVTADIYPYINNGLGIAALIHPRHFAEGESKLHQRLGDADLRATIRKEMETETGWENWYRHIGSDWDKLIVGSAADQSYVPHVGQSLAAIAKAKNEDPWTTFFNLVAANAFVLPESMTEANVIRAMKQEFVSFCTDVGPSGGSSIASHPRAYGAFPRVLSRYVRDQGVISLERAVAQATAVAANEIMAFDRGRIANGMAADVVVFDFDRFTDRATFAEPRRLAEGMKQVLVNGEVVWDNGKISQRRPGRVLRGPGYKPDSMPVTASPEVANELRSLDQLFMSFIKTNKVPGCAVAITDHGRLVYSRGYGFADIAAKTAVSPTSLFRIASISKPITAVAILQLVEQGKLKLDDRVFELLQFQPHLVEGANVDPRLARITIRHLLQHRGGWDRDKSFDAMFQAVRFADSLGVPAPAGPNEVIRCMMGVSLDFDPGERYAYSNLGYCLLGRVIEKLTGQSYEDYVKQKVLGPLGIHSMRLGRSHLEDRVDGEVRYYDPGTEPSVFSSERGQRVPLAYGAFHLEAMDAHGGWLASAIDLVRFARAFDDPEKCAILKPDSIREMLKRPDGNSEILVQGKPADYWYGLGWFVRPWVKGGEISSHTGSLPGTATILIRRPDGRNISVLFNSRVSPTVEHLTRALDGPLHKTLDEIATWPQTDLFPQFTAVPLESNAK